MKRKALCAFLLAGLSGSVAFADTEQTVYVNGGNPFSNFVTELTFSGNDVRMTLDDQTTQTFSMVDDEISIELTYNDDTPTGITEVETAGEVRENRVYTISGQYVGTSLDNLQKGIYIVNGKKVIKK